MMKICNKCQSKKLETEFYTNNTKLSGLRSECKDCSKKQQKYYYNFKKQNPNHRRKKIEIVNNEKQCSQCKIMKSLNEYHKDCYKPLGIRTNCKKCSVSNSQNYNKKNKEKHYQHNKKYRSNKRKNNILYNLQSTLRSRLVGAINRKYWTKKSSFKDIIGCSINELKFHLEKQFKDGMNWDNRGKKGWHIDHIIPLSSAKTEQELYRLCHYTNLQPLWAIDNLKKGKTY